MSMAIPGNASKSRSLVPTTLAAKDTNQIMKSQNFTHFISFPSVKARGSSFFAGSDPSVL